MIMESKSRAREQTELISMTVSQFHSANRERERENIHHGETSERESFTATLYVRARCILCLEKEKKRKIPMPKLSVKTFDGLMKSVTKRLLKTDSKSHSNIT